MEYPDAVRLREYWDRKPPEHEWIYMFFGKQLQRRTGPDDSERMVQAMTPERPRPFDSLPKTVQDVLQTSVN